MAVIDDSLDPDLDDAIDVPHVTGTEEAERLLTPWLGRMLQNPENEKDLGVTLYRFAQKRETEIWYSILHVGDDPKEFVAELLEEAADDCETCRGRVRFIVRVRGMAGCKRFALESPELRKDEDPENTTDFDFHPDAQGTISLLLRHIEKKEQNTLSLFREWREDMKDEKDELRRECRDLRRADDLRRLDEEKLRNMAFAREMEWRKFTRAEERKDKAVETVGNIVQRFLAAKGIVPPPLPPILGENAPIEAQLQQFVEGLRPDQFDPTKLDPNQQVQLQRLIMHVGQYEANKRKPDPMPGSDAQNSTSQKAEGAPSDGKGS